VAQEEDLQKRVEDLIKDLKDERVEVRRLAVEALVRIGESAVPALGEALKDQGEWVRVGAAEALGRIGPEAKSAVPALVEALKDQIVGVRRRAAEALGIIGSEAKSAVPALVEALKGQDAEVREGAAEALGRIGPEAKSAVPALGEALKDQDKWVRLRAAEALGIIGPAAKSAVPALVEALKDQDVWVRQEAAWALGIIGPAAKSAVPALLVEAVKDRTWVGYLASLLRFGEDALTDLVEVAKKRSFEEVKTYFVNELKREDLPEDQRLKFTDLVSELLGSDEALKHLAEAQGKSYEPSFQRIAGVAMEWEADFEVERFREREAKAKNAPGSLEAKLLKELSASLEAKAAKAGELEARHRQMLFEGPPIFGSEACGKLWETKTTFEEESDEARMLNIRTSDLQACVEKIGQGSDTVNREVLSTLVLAMAALGPGVSKREDRPPLAKFMKDATFLRFREPVIQALGLGALRYLKGTEYEAQALRLLRQQALWAPWGYESIRGLALDSWAELDPQGLKDYFTFHRPGLPRGLRAMFMSPADFADLATQLALSEKREGRRSTAALFRLMKDWSSLLREPNRDRFLSRLLDAYTHSKDLDTVTDLAAQEAMESLLTQLLESGKGLSSQVELRWENKLYKAIGDRLGQDHESPKFSEKGDLVLQQTNTLKFLIQAARIQYDWDLSRHLEDQKRPQDQRPKAWTADEVTERFSKNMKGFISDLADIVPVKDINAQGEVMKDAQEQYEVLLKDILKHWPEKLTYESRTGTAMTFDLRKALSDLEKGLDPSDESRPNHAPLKEALGKMH
jgi:HEAT repeat protein